MTSGPVPSTETCQNDTHWNLSSPFPFPCGFWGRLDDLQSWFLKSGDCFSHKSCWLWIASLQLLWERAVKACRKFSLSFKEKFSLFLMEYEHNGLMINFFLLKYCSPWQKEKEKPNTHTYTRVHLLLIATFTLTILVRTTQHFHWRQIYGCALILFCTCA